MLSKPAVLIFSVSILLQKLLTDIIILTIFDHLGMLIKLDDNDL